MNSTKSIRGIVVMSLMLCAMLFALPAMGEAAPFTTLQAGFTQEVFATAPVSTEMGGVAFAPDGDVWVDSCTGSGGSLFRFDLQTTIVVHGTTVHPQVPGSPFPSNAGCGLTNHPDGTMYSNLDAGSNGVANLDVNTAAPIRTLGPLGNALGITIDPQTNHLVYVGSDCRFTATCTIVDLDPVSGTSTNFAVLNSADSQFVDGIAFDTTGNFLFLSNRAPALRLTILNRSGAIVQHIPMTSEPDGIAFHAATPKFVVTNNNDGTITRFDFPADDFTQVPVLSVFASGGFRGDLTQVGSDGCLYVTQDGTRFDDGTTSDDNSIVRICGGFAPPIPQASISGMKFDDLNGNGIKDAGEPGLAGWTIILTKPDATTVSMVTDALGNYTFSGLAKGNYTVNEVVQAGWMQTAPIGGSYHLVVAAGQDIPNADFGNFRLGALSGMKYNDLNANGVKNIGEPGLAGWTIMLKKPDSTMVSTTTDAAGNYSFTGLGPGQYVVSEVVKPGWIQTSPSTLIFTVTIMSGTVVSALDFGNFLDIPTAACVKGVNPSGKNIPPANGGQRPDGFYQLLATDKLDPNPNIFVKDMGSGTIFGPFTSGTTIKYTQARGATPDEKDMGGPDSAVAAHIKGTGDAAVYSVNFAGTMSPEVSCLVPPPPK